MPDRRRDRLGGEERGKERIFEEEKMRSKSPKLPDLWRDRMNGLLDDTDERWGDR